MWCGPSPTPSASGASRGCSGRVPRGRSWTASPRSWRRCCPSTTSGGRSASCGEAVVEWERSNPDGEGSRTWRDQRALHRQCVAALFSREVVRDPEQALRHHPDADVELWAGLLHTFVDGLASQLVAAPGEVGPGDAARLLRSLLTVARTRHPD